MVQEEPDCEEPTTACEEPLEQAEVDDAPGYSDGAEAGHAVGDKEPRGQYEPAGHGAMSVRVEQ